MVLVETYRELAHLLFDVDGEIKTGRELEARALNLTKEQPELFPGATVEVDEAKHEGK